MSENTPRWPAAGPGAEALFKGAKGDKGDKGDAGMTAGARRAFAVLAVIVFVLAAAALLIGVRQVDELNRSLRAECRFDRDIGTAPLTVNATGKVPKLAVEIVVHARDAYQGHGCPGPLPPPAPLLVKWARHYKLPAP